MLWLCCYFSLCFRSRGVEVRVVNREGYTDDVVEWADTIFSAGGDGTFLIAAAKVKNHKPVIGFNTDPLGWILFLKWLGRCLSESYGWDGDKKCLPSHLGEGEEVRSRPMETPGGATTLRPRTSARRGLGVQGPRRNPSESEVSAQTFAWRKTEYKSNLNLLVYEIQHSKISWRKIYKMEQFKWHIFFWKFFILRAHVKPNNNNIFVCYSSEGHLCITRKADLPVDRVIEKLHSGRFRYSLVYSNLLRMMCSMKLVLNWILKPDL